MVLEWAQVLECSASDSGMGPVVGVLQVVLEWAQVLGFLQVVLSWAPVWGALQVVLEQAQMSGFSAGGSAAGTGIGLFGRWF